jgi:hypothetical protein
MRDPDKGMEPKEGTNQAGDETGKRITTAKVGCFVSEGREEAFVLPSGCIGGNKNSFSKNPGGERSRWGLGEEELGR